jgi:HEPN domain-containing protein
MIKTPKKTPDELGSYIAWQNKAFEFYIASRLLYSKKILSPAAFCANQSIESLLKATLAFWDPGFIPKDAAHDIPLMLQILENQVPNGRNVNIAEFFYWDRRYQTVARYPEGGILIPGNFLNEIDKGFYSLLSIVPFQFNSFLVNTLRGSNPISLEILKSKNEEFNNIIMFLKPWIEYRGALVQILPIHTSIYRIG